MAIINGTSNDDLLFVRLNGDIIYGLEGNDLLITEGLSFATLDGGPGDDGLWLTPFPEMFGPARQNLLNGGDGNDVFGGTGHANVVNGEAGNDSFEIAGDNNLLNGGEGDDTVGVTDDAVFHMTGNGNVLNGNEGKDLVGIAGDGNALDGGDGNDLLAVAGSGNLLSGGAGNDQFFSDTGEGNTLSGGEGDDVFSGVNFNNNTFNGDGGNDYASAAVGNNSVLNGGEGDDFLQVGGAHNTLQGGGGNDYLEGFFESADADPAATNILVGGDGDDVLTVFYRGQLTGGEGNDRFDLIHTGAETVITDFQHAARGKCALQAEDVLNVRAWLDFENVAVDKPLKALVGQGYLAVNAGANVGGGAATDTVVQVDTDGRSGAAAPQTIVTLLDTTLTPCGADMNNWLV